MTNAHFAHNIRAQKQCQEDRILKNIKKSPKGLESAAVKEHEAI